MSKIIKFLYIALIQIPVDDQIFNIGFKLSGFRSPVLGPDPVDIPSLVEAEQPQLEACIKELAKKKPNEDLVEELQASVSLPEFLSPYVEGKKTSKSAIFDILSDKEYQRALEDMARAEEDDNPEEAEEVEETAENLETIEPESEETE